MSKKRPTIRGVIYQYSIFDIVPDVIQQEVINHIVVRGAIWLQSVKLQSTDIWDDHEYVTEININ